MPPSSSTAGAIPDPKLQHLITKIIKSSSSDNLRAGISSKQVLETLLHKHREYRRKNSTSLITCIDTILTNIGKSQGLQAALGKEGLTIGKTAASRIDLTDPTAPALSTGRVTTPVPSAPNSPSNLSQKRKREETQSEEEYDKEAANHDKNRLEFTKNVTGGSTMLNANLRNRYKDVQRERDVEAKKKAAEEEKLKAKENGGDGSMTTIPENSASDGNGSAPTKVPTTPSGSTKKKKKKMSRSSSSSALNDMDPQSSMNLSATARPKERYSDLGGMSDILTQIRQLIEYPLAHPELFTHLGIQPPRGVLLRGPPGCGKTHLANAIAGQLNVTYFRISAPEMVSGMSGESESRIRDLFATASGSAPSIIFMDEIDAIAPKRGGDGSSSGGTKGMEKRMVAQLLTCMDSLTPENNRGGAPVMVLGATNRPDSIDSALRRAGRFDREICLGVPDEAGRLGILKVMTASMRLNGDIDLAKLAKKTPGFVGADIRSLTKEAGVIAINRIYKRMLIGGEAARAGLPSSLGVGDVVEDISAKDSANVVSEGDDSAAGHIAATAAPGNNVMENEEKEGLHSEARDIHSVVSFTSKQLEPLFVTMDDFLSAVPKVQPSSKREGFATVPDVSWDNVGALDSIREELSLSVLEPIMHPERFQALGLPLPAGVLLYGPPGCGKTLLAKATAHESGVNFISVKGPELLDKYVGESERAVRQVFERARSSSPCIVFFDELDSLCPKRGSDSGGGGVTERVVNQLLTEMDGLESRSSVFVVAATNRPELIDPAMLRPGRLDKLLYVPLPSPADRAAILKTVAKKVNLSDDVDLDEIAHSSRSDGYSGADCAALLREAGLAVLRKSALGRKDYSKSITDVSNNKTVMTTPKAEIPLQITMHDFKYAFDHVMPSVSKKDKHRYERMRDRMANARSRGGVGDEKKAEGSEKVPNDSKS